MSDEFQREVAKVTALGRNLVELIATGEPQTEPPPRVTLTLATSVPKGDRFDWLVEKSTEVGVSRLIPIQTRRCVVEPRPNKLDRIRRAVIEASKQCGRARLMTLEELTPWPRVIDPSTTGLRLIAHPSGRTLHDWPTIAEGDEVMLAVGPEGGFTDEEVELATAAGWHPVSLGRTILRIETAGIVGCAAILARAGIPLS